MGRMFRNTSFIVHSILVSHASEGTVNPFGYKSNILVIETDRQLLYIEPILCYCLKGSRERKGV